jgi:hypothetical protein
MACGKLAAVCAACGSCGRSCRWKRTQDSAELIHCCLYKGKLQCVLHTSQKKLICLQLQSESWLYLGW